MNAGTWFSLCANPPKFGRSLFYHLRYYQLKRRKYAGVHLGCGNLRIPGFCNVDASAAVASDITAGIERLKFADGTVEVIYASHVFEHVPRAEAEAVIRDWHRVLAPRGKLYLLVPDVEALMRVYLDRLSAYHTADGRREVELAHGILYGGQTNQFDFHYQGFSFTTLSDLLARVGFKEVRRLPREQITICPARDAGYAEISGTPVSLNVEAIKC